MSGGPNRPEPPPDPRPRARKSPEAFRTISEVADDLHIPQHVLRFWETKFAQIKPLKRGGGRRYYRPDDIGLLRRIADLLYTQGYTIKGVQRLLRDGGGSLADVLPPPLAEDHDPDLADQLLPGFEPVAVPRLSRRAPAPPPVLASAPPPPARLPDSEAEAEAMRLRRILTQTLVELQALRSLLTAGG